jgi:hypothetical protein
VIWGDSAKLTIFAYENNPYWKDAVGGHPMHTIASHYFAKMIKNKNYAYKINLFSALCGSLSIFLAMSIVYLEKNRLYSAAATGCALMVSHTFWSYSVVAESYTMIVMVSLFSIFMISLSMKIENNNILLFINGAALSLSITVNSLFIISSIGIYYIIFSLFKRKGLLMFIFGNFAGFILVNLLIFYSGVNLAAYYASGPSAASAYIFPEKILTESLKMILYICYQFPSFFILFISLSFFIEKKPLNIGLTAASISTILFSSLYLYQKQFVLMILPYAYLSVSGGLAFSEIEKKLSLSFKIIIFILNIAAPVACYRYSSDIVKYLNVNLIHFRPAQGRNLSYFLSPWKNGHFYPYIWAKNLLEKVNNNSVVYADFTLNRVLLYMIDVEKIRADVSTIEIDKWIYSKNGEEEYVRSINKSIDNGKSIYIAQDYNPYYKVDMLENIFNLKCDQGLCQILKK